MSLGMEEDKKDESSAPSMLLSLLLLSTTNASPSDSLIINMKPNKTVDNE
eukprot:CAMPEP_0202470648 /NCGR_PEP_ID=MMETSP1360-20130828/82238_1 /ASSEMBLY_ACC=CAM_ASM_000848 /TAXON_ID=515479 /ORGANISM="Licmophora paradoxa, Strain CCMP2313" /LENGTH=49 /DNA_ID=CAMNT_0049096419 /DNA_START=326 /DNA_END=475 /DNA_ORIENTATION=-